MALIQQEQPDSSWLGYTPEVIVDVSLAKWHIKNINGPGFKGPIPRPPGASWLKATMAAAQGGAVSDTVTLEVHAILEDGRNQRSPLLTEGKHQEFGDNRIERYTLGSAKNIGVTVRGLSAEDDIVIRLEFFE